MTPGPDYAANLPAGTITAGIDPALATPCVSQWNLSIQHAIGGYAGNINDTPAGSADFGAPDGLWFDHFGRLWIQTDQAGDGAGEWQKIGSNTMLCADPDTREVRRFLTSPPQCEVTGVVNTPDGTTIFVASSTRVNTHLPTTPPNTATGRGASLGNRADDHVPRCLPSYALMAASSANEARFAPRRPRTGPQPGAWLRPLVDY